MCKKIKRLIGLWLCVSILAGCSETIELNIEPVLKERTYLEKQDLEDPVSQVRIMIDNGGYETKDSKKVFFIGLSERESFKVIEKDTKQVVYEDETYPNGNVYAGDFSDVKAEGEYYIETKKLGRSYPFSVTDDKWDKLFVETLERTEAELQPTNENDLLETALGVHVLLFALQSYPEVFKQDNTMITALLKTASQIMALQNEEGSFFDDYKATSVCAGVLLMCAKQFGKYDDEMSKSFMNTVTKAEKWLDNHQAELNGEAYFYYMCQRFHIDKESGIYKAEIEDYIENHIAQIADDEYSLLGAALYISAERNTNRDICTKIMQSIVSKIEKITEKVKKREFMVDTESLENMMQEALLVCFIDYITPSREYMEIIKNTMHYLLGANVKNEVLLQNTEEWNSFWSCICVLSLADINN